MNALPSPIPADAPRNASSMDSGGSPTSYGRLPRLGTPFDPNEHVIGQVICEGGTPNMEKVQFRLLAPEHTAPGHVLGVRGEDQDGNDVLTLIRVEDVREHNPHEDALSSNIQDVIPFETRYAPEGESTVIYRAAKADILEEVVYKRDKTVSKITNARTLPRSGNPVVDVPPALIAEALGLAPDPDTGFDIGHVHGTKKPGDKLSGVPVRLKRGVVQTHFFICGGIGQGKSYGRGVLAEEFWAHGLSQVNIDPMGEMVKATEELGGANVKPGVGGFTLPLSALQSADVIDAIPGFNKKTNIFTLIEEAHERLIQEVAIEKGEEFGVDELIAKIKEIAPQLQMDAAGTLYPAIKRAGDLRHFKYIGAPFDWEKELAKPGSIVNIDARGYTVRDLRLITASVARDLQRLARARKIPFTVLSMDEAHLIAPNDDRVVTTQVLREIARIGRHYRLGLVMTTQSPADLDRPILKRLLTRLIFAIESDQLDALRGVFSDAPDEIIRQLPKLPRGTCLVTGVRDTITHATLVDIRERVTAVGGATPDIFADLAERGFPGRRSLGMDDQTA